MVNKWTTTSLKDLGIKLIDCDHKTPKAVDNGIPYIGIPQMDNGRINFDANPRLISEEDFIKWTRKADPKYGDVILSRRCNSGETVYVPKNSKFALGQNLVLLRPTDDRIHPEYLRWVVHGYEWWNEVAKYLNPGAIFESLKCADIPKFKIPEPPKRDQIKISEVLSAISDKIELNHQSNQTLEQMAQALFKSWFIDFDPVIDNALDAGITVNDFPEALQHRALLRKDSRKQAELLNEYKPLPDDIRALFPSEFEQTDEPSIGIKGWIPK
ncbi:MAG: restriction endonuclease subunit S, partial [Colwellia sp.]|nr:restriction endonuclease subunit S [Colwellia sp.]